MAYRELRFSCHTLRNLPMIFFLVTMSHLKLMGELRHPWPIKSLFTVSHISFCMYSLANFVTILNCIDTQFNHFVIKWHSSYGTPVVLHRQIKENWSLGDFLDWSLTRNEPTIDRESERAWESEWASEERKEGVYFVGRDIALWSWSFTE